MADWPVWVGPLGGALVGGGITAAVTYVTTRLNWRRTRDDLAVDRLDESALALRTAALEVADKGWEQHRVTAMDRAASLVYARAVRARRSDIQKRFEKIYRAQKNERSNQTSADNEAALAYVEFVSHWLQDPEGRQPRKTRKSLEATQPLKRQPS